MIVVVTGAPGAGKGTQADLLVARCGFGKLSTGDALRKQVKLGTEIGKIAGTIMERGELVPDHVLLEILKAELAATKAKVILLDGYPRNLAQAEALGKIEGAHGVRGAVHLDVPQATLIERLSGRRVCGSCGASYHVSANPSKVTDTCDRCGGRLEQRADDRKEAVAVRLDVYEKNTQPVLAYYERLGVYRKVNGLGSTEEVFARLKAAIDVL